MNEKKNIKNLEKKIVRVLRKHGVKKAGLFGSFVRGDAKKGSDIDILIEFKGRKSLLDLVRVERELGEYIGKKVDLVEYYTLHPKLKDKILEEEVRII